METIVPDRAAVFLGDSIMEAFVPASVAPSSVSFGVPGQRSDHLLSSLAGYKSLARARNITVMIGTNDVAQGKDAGLEGRYQQILDRLPQHVPVMLVSILPIDRPNIGDRAKAARDAAQRACTAVPRCTFVDAYSGFISNGHIAPGLLRDGVHPTGAGYRVLRDLIAASRPPG